MAWTSWPRACRVARSRTEIAGVPVSGGVDSVTEAVGTFRADTVAVVNCAQMSSFRLRELAWALEKTGTDLCVAPALLDLAGPPTTIRPVAGLPLVHLDHANLSGPKRILKGAFDRVMAASALLLLSPLLLAIAWAIHFTDGGPVLFRHTRIGKDGSRSPCTNSAAWWLTPRPGRPSWKASTR